MALIGCISYGKSKTLDGFLIGGRNIGARTMSDYFDKRYDSKGMKILSAVVIFVFLVPYSAAVYKGLGSLFSAVFPGVICLVVAVLNHDSVGGLGGLIENLKGFESLPGDPNPTTGSQLTDIFGGSSFRFLLL